MMKTGLRHSATIALMQRLLYTPPMPTVRRFRNSKLALYYGDHNPPHFHVVGPGFAVLVDIETLAIIGGRARANDIAEALAWARGAGNRDKLRRLWTKYQETER